MLTFRVCIVSFCHPQCPLETKTEKVVITRLTNLILNVEGTTLLPLFSQIQAGKQP